MTIANSPALLQELEAKRELIIQTMLRTTIALPGVSDVDRRQFVAGYFDLMAEAARGDLGPRDTYLETVIPGIKRAGMAFDYVVAQMAGVSMAVASIVAAEHLEWHATFARDYVSLLMHHWGRAS